MRRSECLQALAPMLTDQLVVTNVARTGFETHMAMPREGNLYTMGMGLVTPVVLGLALSLPHRPFPARGAPCAVARRAAQAGDAACAYLAGRDACFSDRARGVGRAGTSGRAGADVRVVGDGPVVHG